MKGAYPLTVSYFLWSRARLQVDVEAEIILDGSDIYTSCILVVSLESNMPHSERTILSNRMNIHFRFANPRIALFHSERGTRRI